MNRSVIHHNDCSHPELRNQTLLNVEQEHVSIDTAHDAHGGNQAIEAHATNQRDVLARVPRSLTVIQAFANWGATPQASHSQMDTRCINEYQVTWVDGETPESIRKPQILDPLAVLLRGNQCFF